MRLACLILVCMLAAGCASSPPPHPEPSPAQRLQGEREEANARHATELLESGQIYAGLSIADLLVNCTPYQIHFVDRFAFIEFHSVPNLTGLSLVAVNGKLASATYWTCTQRQDFFNTLSADERIAAGEIYESRLFRGR